MMCHPAARDEPGCQLRRDGYPPRLPFGLSGRCVSEVGRLLKKHQPYVARYETGQKRIDVVELLRIAKALNVKASDIVARLEE